MLYLDDPGLDGETANGLRRYQAKVDAARTYPERIAAGKKLFSSYNRRENRVFRVVRERLATMCSGARRCGYCEDSAGDERQDKGYNCGKTAWNHSRHVWDRRDAEGLMGATACIVIPWFIPRYEADTPWKAMAWWVHDHLPYSDMMFFAVKGKNCAFNLGWHEHEKPARRIEAYSPRKVLLTKRGMANHEGDHCAEYPGFPELDRY